MDESPTTGGRGARGRILAAATRLFHEQGINATGMAELCAAAHVSTRTMYKHFASKDDLVSVYLRRFDDERMLGREQALHRTELPAVERLRAVFGRPQDQSVRGCPFHNAAVELADEQHPARAVVAAHKAAFLALLTETAAEAGAANPTVLGQQLAVVFEGATALGTSLGNLDPIDHARSIADLLIAGAIDQPAG
ncbi:MAG TPA: helix-turn-helix domain-containing protein [Pseudonocardiaceae bacterium]|nr:helix-turn-helix domain-containing protein [Pseudonocardiaceae bacterium]